MCVVLDHARAVVVHEAQNDLRGGIALVDGPEVPEHRLFVILKNALAFAVDEVQIGLGAGMALVAFCNGSLLSLFGAAV